MRRYLFYLLFISIVSGSCSTNKYMSDSGGSVTQLTNKTSISEGSLIYGLPLSVLDIELVAERIIEKPGPYARFAGNLLGLTDIISDENETWSIKSIRINTHQELDPEEFYVIEASTLFQTNVLAMKREGLIMDLNPQIYEKKSLIYSETETDLSKLRIFDLGSDEYFQDKKDTVYKMVSVDTAFVRVPYMVEKKQTLSIDELAENAAARLMEIRDGKHLILTGETNVFPQNEAPINEMNRLEKEYTELFAGKVIKDIHVFNYQLIPNNEMAGKQTAVCTFSEATGPGPSTQKSGTPVTIELIPERKTRNLKVTYIQTKESSSQKSDKLYYRVPDIVTVKVAYGDKLINSSRKLMYQFGEIVRLPENYLIGNQ